MEKHILKTLALLCAIAVLLVFSPLPAQYITHAQKIDFSDGPSQGTHGGRINSIEVDASGNTYICGYGRAPVDFGNGPIQYSQLRVLFIAKYNPSGSLLWHKAMPTSNPDLSQIYSFFPAPNGDLWFSVSFREIADIWGISTPQLPPGHWGIAWCRMDSNGNMQSLIPFPGNEFCDIWKATGAANGDLFVAGHLQDSLQIGSQSLVSEGGDDLFIARLEPSGAPVWIRQFHGRFRDYANIEWGPESLDLNTDASGSLLVSALLLDSAKVGGNTYHYSSGYGTIMAKFDSTGNLLWSNRFPGHHRGVACDSAGNIYGTGYFASGIDFGIQSFYQRGGGDMFLVKYDPSGSVVWVNQGGGPEGDITSDLQIGPGGDIYVVGVHGEDALFGNVTLQSINSDQNLMVLQYDTSGGLVGASHWGRPDSLAQNDLEALHMGIGFNPNGDLVLAGSFKGILDLDGIPLSQDGQGRDGFIAWKPGIPNGILENTAAGFFSRVFPNPSKGRFQVQFEARKPGTLHAQLHDLQGRRLPGTTLATGVGINQFEMDCTDLPAGLYFLKMELNGLSAVQKVVIE